MWTFRNYNLVVKEYWEMTPAGEAQFVQQLSDGRWVIKERKTAQQTALWLWYEVLKNP